MNPLYTDDAEHIVELFKHIQKLFKQQILENSELKSFTLPQLMTMKVLYAHPGINLTELSEHMSLAKSTVSGIVDRLVEQGIVVRERPENNRRIICLRLSDESLAKKDSILSMREAYARRFLSHATKEDVACVLKGLETLSRLMEIQ